MGKLSFTIQIEVAPAEARELLALGAVESRTLAALAPDRRDALAAAAPHRRIARVGPEGVGLLLADDAGQGKTLRALHVRPEWRRRGIARALVEHWVAAVGGGTFATAPVDSRDLSADLFFRALGWSGEEQGGRQMRRDLDTLPPVPALAGYRLRTYEEGDGAAWTRVLRNAFATEEGRHAPSADDAFQREFLANALWEPARLFFAVREPDGEVAGTTASWESEIEGRRVGLIHWVAVDPVHRGHGLGEALNLAALHDMRARGHREAYLNTSAELRSAVRLYERLGFQVSRRSIVYRM
jgi:mycothiol synthase